MNINTLNASQIASYVAALFFVFLFMSFFLIFIFHNARKRIKVNQNEIYNLKPKITIV
jgi:preprotein translocase subunit YajC